MLSEYILIGQVVRPQGVKGQVKVRPDTNEAERFLDLSGVEVLENGEYSKLDIFDAAVRDGFVYLTLGGDLTRDDAEKRRDLMLYLKREDALKLDENECFICDLIGCKAYDTDNNELGEVTDVMQPGANDVYVIKTKKGEMLVPAVKKVVAKIDVKNRRLELFADVLPEVAVMD